jgi:hypothetical protein
MGRPLVFAISQADARQRDETFRPALLCPAGDRFVSRCSRKPNLVLSTLLPVLGAHGSGV